MQFDLNNLNEGTWFSIEGTDARICLRGITPDDARRIRKDSIKKNKLEFGKDGKPHYIPVEDEDRFFDLLWDYYIVSWENIKDQNGNDIKCNKENKILLMGKSAKFSSMVTKYIDQLNEALSVEREQDEKN